MHTINSGSNLSDHLPLCFQVNIQCLSASYSLSIPAFSHSSFIDWSKASSCDIDNFQEKIAQDLMPFPSSIYDCVCTDCSHDHHFLDSYAQDLVSILLQSAEQFIPVHSRSSSRKLVGWNYQACHLKKECNFWYKVWVEAGSPTSGALFNIRNRAKRQYKHEVCRLKRDQQHLLKRKLASSFAAKRKHNFWSAIKAMNKSTSSTRVSSIDGINEDSDNANLFASKIKRSLNTHSINSHDNLSSSEVTSSLSNTQLQDVLVSVDEIFEVTGNLKSNKSDESGVSSEHLKFAMPVIVESLASFFTAILRHGYMPKCLRDCVLIPIPKSGRLASSSENYRPIALASSLSKLLEHLILSKYSSFLYSHSLQFGFKSGFSTTFCTGLVKNVISKFIRNGSSVLGCFLDASKAFDLVDHHKLFQKLIARGLSLPILHFLSNWYSSQELKVCWGSCLSEPFCVSNGVRQGGVLSPVLFTVYLDGLLDELSNSGVGCYWGSMFVGAFCYAYDIVLLAPCASALRSMLNICNSYAKLHDLMFNECKF